MMTLRSLKTLLWVKQRRLDDLEKHAQAMGVAVQECIDACAQADQQVQNCRDDEASCSYKIESLGNSELFNPSHIVTLQYVLQGLVELTNQAVQVAQQAVKRLAEAQQRLAEARMAVQRASLQLDHLEEERQKLLRLADQEMEDTQDEESEEAAVARGVAQRHAKARMAAAEVQR